MTGPGPPQVHYGDRDESAQSLRCLAARWLLVSPALVDLVGEERLRPSTSGYMLLARHVAAGLLLEAASRGDFRRLPDITVVLRSEPARWRGV